MLNQQGNVLSSLPQLRKRKGDIPLLIKHFIDKFNQKYSLKIETVSPEAEEKLINYEWPGNVRELENKIERGMIHAEGDVLEAKDFELDPNTSDGERAFLDLEGMWNLIVEGKIKIDEVTKFKHKWGENLLKELIKKAFAKTKSQKEAGRLLGCYTSADEEPGKYSIFRQECTKLGVKIRDFK